MPLNCLHTPGWCCLLDLPQPNRSRKVATGKQASIGAPGDPIHRTRGWQDLSVGAVVSIPELDPRSTPTPAKQPATSIKGPPAYRLPMTASPQQSPPPQLPPLSRPIPPAPG